MNQDKKNIALVLIDVQKGFDDSEYWGGGRNNPDAEKVCAQLLTKFRQLQCKHPTNPYCIFQT